jgi:hypothetical protein
MRRARPESDGFTSLALMNQLVNPPDPVAQAGLQAGRPSNRRGASGSIPLHGLAKSVSGREAALG